MNVVIYSSWLQDALRTFLLRKLDNLAKNDKCQITMISTWATELYLDKVCFPWMRQPCSIFAYHFSVLSYLDVKTLNYLINPIREQDTLAQYGESYGYNMNVKIMFHSNCYIVLIFLPRVRILIFNVEICYCYCCLFDFPFSFFLQIFLHFDLANWLLREKENAPYN